MKKQIAKEFVVHKALNEELARPSTHTLKNDDEGAIALPKSDPTRWVDLMLILLESLTLDY